MASLTSSLPPARRTTLYCLLALLACGFLGMAQKPKLTVRFYEEANERDTDRFARPFLFHHPDRKGFLNNIPPIHEKMIKAVYPFQAPDGSWGCTFILDHSGRLALEVISTSRNGSTLVAFVSTKNGTHQVVDLLVDKPITDGIISIPRGLTELETAAISKTWPVLGQKKR